MIKIRREEQANYRSIWCNGKTVRFAIDPSKPIAELKYPEFFDIKVTGNCHGKCEYCYQNSGNEPHYTDIVEKTRDFFSKMKKEDLPYQTAIGGGEPTSHPDFVSLLKMLKEEFDICPNYTTNGMFVKEQHKDDVIEATKKYCGGVAISCHPHLREYWEEAANILFDKTRLNFHLIISDAESIDYFTEIYDTLKDKIEYFVLLPYGVQGRAIPKEVNWQYLLQKLPQDQRKIAFGANFYQYLLKGGHNVKVSLYGPELMSKYLDLKDMKLYPSSFNLKSIN